MLNPNLVFLFLTLKIFFQNCFLATISIFHKVFEQTWFDANIVDNLETKIIDSIMFLLLQFIFGGASKEDSSSGESTESENEQADTKIDLDER